MTELQIINQVIHIANRHLALPSMLQKITEALRNHFQSAFVACAIQDPASRQFIYPAMAVAPNTRISNGYELDNAVVEAIFETDGPVTLSAIAGFKGVVESTQSGLFLPIRKNHKITAILALESTRKEELTGQVPLLETICYQLASAIESARMTQATKKHAEMLEIANMVSHIALAAADSAQQLREITRYIASQFPVSAVSILLLDESGEKFTIETVAGAITLNDPTEKGEWPITRGVCGRCIREGTPQLITDPDADDDYIVGHPDVEAEYIVPLRHKDEILGVLNLESTEADVFDDYSCQVFQNIAEQIAGAIHLANLNKRLAQANRELELLSNSDELTGIANRRRFNKVLRTEWRRCQRMSEPLALILSDLDYFKNLNDSQGHLYGDSVLKTIAQTMQQHLSRASDFVARYGGEEFAIILPGATLEEAEKQARHLQHEITALKIPHHRSPLGDFVTISMGVSACLPSKQFDDHDLIMAADSALYAAKDDGRNCFRTRPLAAA